MKYIVKTMGGEKITITEDEYKTILATPSGFIAFPSCGVTINASRIESVYPESSADVIEEKRNQQLGVLHDGTQVRRHFGQWVDATNQVPDDKGNYNPIKIDPEYYPEVARDCVPSPEEFEKKYRALPVIERLALMIQGTIAPRLSNPSVGFQSVSSLLPKV